LLSALGCYIYNLISGLLLADVAINLHKSSKCEVPSSFKDLVDVATTTSGTGADVFTVFLVVLCLTAIMSLAEEYKSLSSRTEEDKGDCPLSNQFSITTVAALVMTPVAVALACVEGGDLRGALNFNGTFMIPFLCGLLPIILYISVRQYQLQDLAISSMSSFLQVLLCAGSLCALVKEIVQEISWLPNLTG
jgi:Mn2+/Fe2+ NRAMP family transporter